MYIHTRDWDAAEYVAQNHCQEGLVQVLVAKASEAAEAGDFATAESLLLRAHKPEIIIDHYKVVNPTQNPKLNLFLKSVRIHFFALSLRKNSTSELVSPDGSCDLKE